MKLNIFIAICVGVLGYFVTFYFTHMSAPVSMNSVDKSVPQAVDGEMASDFSFTDLKGRSHRLSDFKGKVVILNFWASWCAPCVKEFPDLLKIAKVYEDDVAFVAVSSDFREDHMNRFLDKIGQYIGFSDNVYVALDQNNTITHDLYGAYKIPVTLIITSDFYAADLFVGANWTYEEFEAVLKKYL